MTNTFQTAEQFSTFLKGGRAVFTLESLKTGAHYTYRVNQKDDASPFFVGLLAGPDNTSDYVYVGLLRDGLCQTTKKSKLTCDSVPVKALNFVLQHVGAGRLPTDAVVRHEGRCGVCGRALTTPESLDRGIGPECWSKLSS